MMAVHGTIPNLLVTTYLHMTSKEQFRPAYTERQDIRVETFAAPTVEFYRFLYRSVGEQLRWRDRLIMSESELQSALSQPGTSVHVLYIGENPAGYVELVRVGSSTEITYFGLFPAYQGMGLGKHLLSYGIDQAWQVGVEKVWVHTCNLDSPHALDNYLKRGFVIDRVQQDLMPDRYR
jgi:GNAT superfamily N-acetyltransferase